MPSQLTVSVVPLRDLFSGKYQFHLPWFQRSYAWQIPQVGRLLTNLFDGLDAPPDTWHYMLGNLMLARADDKNGVAIVDGHQRILTITILLAVLRDLEPDEKRRDALHKWVSTRVEGSTEIYHLQPQASLIGFLYSVVQRPGATANEPDEFSHALSETERNIVENRDYLRAELSAKSVPVETRRSLANFLIEACHVVVRIADTEDNAWEMLRIEEETRLDFNHSARAKASLIAVMDPDDRQEAARIWDNCQQLLGAQDTYSLLNHVRAIKLRKRSSTSLEADICRHYEVNKSGRKFMETVFEPCAKRMASIRKGEVSQGADRASIARSSQLLLWVNPDQWMPAAIHWLSVRGADDPNTALFFKRLERLVWVQRLAGIDPPRQETRINRLLGQIDKDIAPDDMSELKIEASLRKEALTSLRRVNFRRKHIAVNVLRLASVEMGDDAHTFSDKETPTVEHVFPLSPAQDGEWRKTFKTPALRKNYVNRLGNLTILSRVENQRAGNLEWADKRSTLAGSKYSLSRAAAQSAHWTPEVIDAHTEELIQILFMAWEIPVQN